MTRFDWFVPQNDIERKAKARAMAFFYALNPDKYEEDKDMLEPDWLGKPESETEPIDEYDLDDYNYNQSKDRE